jgi:DNA-binding NarL/FixJ family response regulator
MSAPRSWQGPARASGALQGRCGPPWPPGASLRRAVSIRIAVVGTAPTWRRGVASVLAEAGYEPVEVDTLGQWRPGAGGSAVVARIGGDNDFEALHHLTASHHHIPVIVVLHDASLPEVAAAVRAGATTAIADDDDVDAIASSVAAALSGRSLVPTSIVRALAARVPASPDPDQWITDQQAGWLRELASGTIVADIARHAGYSEREMFRLLGDLYTRIGVANRTEAIIWATRHAVLDEPPD